MDKYRIMTFDGGGIRGALTVELLKRLNIHFPRLIKKTNLFAGTSTGSFIALGLAYGLSPEDLLELYSEKNSKFIFSPKHLDLLRPKYDNERLKKILGLVFPKNLRIGDLKHYVLVPSFRVIDKNLGNWSPILYNNFPNSETLDEYVIDVALSSSAAPIYFPSYQNHIDGGVFANNPSTAAIAIAKDKEGGKQNLDNIYLLSIGTGYNSHKIMADIRKWGAVEWVLYPNPPLPIISILFEGVVEADTLFSSQLLGEQCFRLNPLLPQSIPLDGYTKIPELITLAENFDLGQTIDWIKCNWF